MVSGLSWWWAVSVLIYIYLIGAAQCAWCSKMWTIINHKYSQKWLVYVKNYNVSHVKHGICNLARSVREYRCPCASFILVKVRFVIEMCYCRSDFGWKFSTSYPRLQGHNTCSAILIWMTLYRVCLWNRNTSGHRLCGMISFASTRNHLSLPLSSLLFTRTPFQISCDPCCLSSCPRMHKHSVADHLFWFQTWACSG